MNWQQVWGVLKWVLAVLAAGFIGQFGKSLAMFLIKRRRAKQLAEQGLDHTGASVSSSQSPVVNSNEAKIEKKRAKAQVKRLKKS